MKVQIPKDVAQSQARHGAPWCDYQREEAGGGWLPALPGWGTGSRPSAALGEPPMIGACQLERNHTWVWELTRRPCRGQAGRWWAWRQRPVRWHLINYKPFQHQGRLTWEHLLIAQPPSCQDSFKVPQIQPIRRTAENCVRIAPSGKCGNRCWQRPEDLLNPHKPQK